MTNSLSAFSLLEAREDCDLCLVGGMYRRRTAAFVGPTAEDTLRALGIDAAFIGANGILDGDEFRRAFINMVRVDSGLSPNPSLHASYDLDGALDRLADVVREHLDLKAIYRILQLKR